MPDSTTDPDEVGGAAPSSGARRSGLDRLRATRGGAGAAPVEERATRADRPARAESVGSADRSGSTALLESPEPVEKTAAEEVDASATESAEQGAGATGTRKKGKKGRLRRRGAAADAASAVAGTAGATRKRGARPVDSTHRSASRVQIAIAAVLTLLVIGLATWVTLWRHRIWESKDQKAVQSLVEKQTDATAFARRFAVTFFSPDYKTVDDYNKTVSAQSTGDFKKDFDGKQGQLKSVLTQAQSQATGKVLTAGASKVSGNTVEVLVVVDQDVKNATTKGKTVTNRYRVRETVQKVGKDWLVQGLEPVT